jgi:flagellar biosynthesis/type III secretory pathway M-ring protein FliF/YscJ
MKRIFLIGLALLVVILIVLFVYPGRGSQPDYPLLYHYQSESDPYANVSTAACQ